MGYKRPIKQPSLAPHATPTAEPMALPSRCTATLATLALAAAATPSLARQAPLTASLGELVANIPASQLQHTHTTQVAVASDNSTLRLLTSVDTMVSFSTSTSLRPMSDAVSATLIASASALLLLLITTALWWYTKSQPSTTAAAASSNSSGDVLNGRERLRMQALFLVSLFFSGAAATNIVPEAFDLCLDLKALASGAGGALGWVLADSATFSGVLLGLPFLFRFVTLLWARCTITLPWDQRRVRDSLVGATAGCVAFNVLCGLATGPTARLSAGWSVGLLILARSGLSLFGFIGLVQRQMALHATPKSEYVPFNVARSVVMSLGIGSGPLLSAAIARAMPAASAGARIAVSCYILAACLVMWLAVFVATTPTDLEPMMDAAARIELAASEKACQEKNKDLGEEGRSAVLAEEAQSERLAALDALRKQIFIASLLIGLERCMLVSGLESATSFIFETEYQLPNRDAALLIGCTFIYGMPLALAVLYVRHVKWVSDQRLVLGLSSVAVCATSLLFQYCSDDEVGCSALSMGLICTSDVIAFPMAYLGQGIVDGIAIELAMSPHPSPWSRENYMLASSMIGDGLGRFVGPTAARFLVDKLGRSAYAAFMLVCAALTGLSAWHATSQAYVLRSLR